MRLSDWLGLWFGLIFIFMFAAGAILSLPPLTAASFIAFLIAAISYGIGFG